MQSEIGYNLAVTAGTAPRTIRNAYIAWIAVCVLWGTTYLGIRIALETIPPGLVGGLRYTAAGTLLLAILASRGEGVVPRSQWLGLAFIGFLTICIGNGGVIWAEQWVPSGIAAVTVATVPFWMIGVDAFRRDGDPLTGRLVAGLLIGFAGILLLVWRDITAGGGAAAYTYALRYLPTATVSLYAYANPVIAIVLGALLVGEPFGPRVIIASLMVLTGSALVQWREKKKAAAAADGQHAAA